MQKKAKVDPPHDLPHFEEQLEPMHTLNSKSIFPC